MDVLSSAYAHILQNRMRRPGQVARCPHVLGNTYTPAYEAGNALRYAKCSLSKAPPIHLFNIWCSLLNCTKPPPMPLFCKCKASTNAMSLFWTVISKIKICIQAIHCFEVGLFSCSALMHRGKGPETQFMSHLKPSFWGTQFLLFIHCKLYSCKSVNLKQRRVWCGVVLAHYKPGRSVHQSKPNTGQGGQIQYW